MKQYLPSPSTILSFALGGLLLGSHLVFGFTEPGQLPGGGNVLPPLNISGEGQSKAGGLILNTGGGSIGLIVDKGSVGVGTSNPKGIFDVQGATSSPLALFNQLGSGDIADFQSNGQSVFKVTKTGIVLPRVMTVERNSAPVTGLFIYNTTTRQVEVFNGDFWMNMQGVISFTGSTTYTYTSGPNSFVVPQNTTKIFIEAWGAGAGGGGGAEIYNVYNFYAGGGGGGGAYASMIAPTTPSTALSVTVGAGGAGGAGDPGGGSGGAGGAGGSSGVTGLLTVAGGTGGGGAPNGSPGAGGVTNIQGGINGSNGFASSGGTGGNGGSGGSLYTDGLVAGGGGGGGWGNRERGPRAGYGGNGARGKVIISW